MNPKEPDFVPVYFKLQRMLLEEVENGSWKPGEIIPSEKEIAEAHHVSIGTVKKAVLNLVNEGYLFRIQGKGTFVAGTTITGERLRYYRFLTHFNANEAEIQIRFLNLKIIKCPQGVHSYLKINPKDKVYEIERIVFYRMKPIVYTISYLPQKMFMGLEEFSKIRFEKIPLYISLEEKYGLPTIFNQELISAVKAESYPAKMLGIRKGTNVLLIEMLAFTYKEQRCEYRVSYCRTDRKKLFREI